MGVRPEDLGGPTDAADNTIAVNEAAYWRLKSSFEFERKPGRDSTLLLLAEKAHAG